MNTKTGEQTFTVRTEEGKDTDSSYIKQGDLIQINLRDTWESGNPIPGFFVGKGFSETHGDLILVKIPVKIDHDNSSGVTCGTKLEEYVVDKITHVQFLARGSAAYILFHNFVGGLSLKNKALQDRLEKIKNLAY